MDDKQQATISLVEEVRWQLLWLGAGLFLACLLLLFVYAWHATELTTNSLMQLEAQSLLHQAAEKEDFQLPRGKTLSAYRNWQSIPDRQRDHFGESPGLSGEILEATVTNEAGEVEYLYLLRHVDEHYGELYLVGHHSAVEIQEAFLDLFYSAIQQAFGLTTVIFIALFFLVRWLINRTTKPLTQLSQWAAHLGTNPDQPLTVNFPVKELNQLALQLREGVSRIQAFNLREQQFLKHASHELRTPLAIIQASLDTLDLQTNENNRVIVKRALKASANMRQLSSALLWLARELDSPIQKSKIEVGYLCEQIFAEHRTLLIDRDIKVRLNISVDTIEIEKDLYAIVVSNLIRNAFQHSGKGIVDIDITSSKLTVVNPASDQVGTDKELGFGLGLQLVERICNKLSWGFIYKANEKKVDVTVFINDGLKK
jgi:signal transduction histidine kinase